MPLRKVFVQRPNTEKKRASVLGSMVSAREERPLDALLLLHALEPVLQGSPLPLSTWAKMLSRDNTPCTSSTASRAFDRLVSRKLATKTTRGGLVVVAPKLEDGSGRAWTRPGRDAPSTGRGYFTIPYDYWTSGLVDRLTLPGKAMFLIMLAETSQKQSFAMAIERAQEWYGISERTAERGYRQLADAGVLLQRRQVVAEPRSPTGVRAVWHRALKPPYSTDARADLQRATKKAAEKRSTPKAGKKMKKVRRVKRKTTGRVDAN
jgi:hypothetical protein